jgi:hypothetical protein
VWVKVRPNAATGGTTVEVAGLAKASGDDPKENVDELVKYLIGEAT